MKNDFLNEKQIRRLILFSGIILFTVLNFKLVITIIAYIIKVFSPFILGAVIAFVLYVPMSFIENKLLGSRLKFIKVKRLISFFITLLIIFAILALVIFIVVPEMVDAVNTIVIKAPGQLEKLEKWARPYYDYVPSLREWSDININDIDWQKIGQKFMSFLLYGAGGIFSTTVGIISNIFSKTLTLFISFIFAIYVLFSKEVLRKQSKKIIYAFWPEEKSDRIVEIVRLISKTFSNFISGQLLEAFILGFMFWLSLSIFRFPYAFLIGILIAITALIPIVGAFIGCIIGAFLLLVINPMMALWFLILFITLQQIEGNFIYPYVVGNKVGLPSLWVLMAVTVGGSLMGVTGILIFIPIFSVIYTLIKEDTSKRLVDKNIDREKWEIKEKEKLVKQKSNKK